MSLPANYLTAFLHQITILTFLQMIALQGEVSEVCGEEGTNYEQIVEKLAQDIELNSK